MKGFNATTVLIPLILVSVFFGNILANSETMHQKEAGSINLREEGKGIFSTDKTIGKLIAYVTSDEIEYTYASQGQHYFSRHGIILFRTHGITPVDVTPEELVTGEINRFAAIILPSLPTEKYTTSFVQAIEAFAGVLLLEGNPDLPAELRDLAGVTLTGGTYADNVLLTVENNSRVPATFVETGYLDVGLSDSPIVVDSYVDFIKDPLYDYYYPDFRISASDTNEIIAVRHLNGAYAGIGISERNNIVFCGFRLLELMASRRAMIDPSTLSSRYICPQDWVASQTHRFEGGEMYMKFLVWLLSQKLMEQGHWGPIHWYYPNKAQANFSPRNDVDSWTVNTIEMAKVHNSTGVRGTHYSLRNINNANAQALFDLGDEVQLHAIKTHDVSSLQSQVNTVFSEIGYIPWTSCNHGDGNPHYLMRMEMQNLEKAGIRLITDGMTGNYGNHYPIPYFDYASNRISFVRDIFGMARSSGTIDWKFDTSNPAGITQTYLDSRFNKLYNLSFNINFLFHAQNRDNSTIHGPYRDFLNFMMSKPNIGSIAQGPLYNFTKKRLASETTILRTKQHSLLLKTFSAESISNATFLVPYNPNWTTNKFQIFVDGVNETTISQPEIREIWGESFMIFQIEDLVGTQYIEVFVDDGTTIPWISSPEPGMFSGIINIAWELSNSLQNPTFDLIFWNKTQEIILAANTSSFSYNFDTRNYSDGRGFFLLIIAYDGGSSFPGPLFLFEINNVNSPPSVSFLYPKGGGMILHGLEIIRWEASDQENDPLLFSLELWSENAWIRIADKLATTSYTFDTTAFQNREDYRMKVIANDSMLGSEAISSTFAVKNSLSELPIPWLQGIIIFGCLIVPVAIYSYKIRKKLH